MNLSPACAERTEWLTEMLDNMTDGLLDHIESKLLRLTEDFDPELLTKMRERLGAEQSERKQKWELVYDQRAVEPEREAQNVQGHVVQMQMEVVGKRINYRNERRVQKLYR